MYELAMRPEAVAKLRTEILERVGPHGAPTYTDLKEMKYLQYILNETLRLYPSSKNDDSLLEICLLF